MNEQNEENLKELFEKFVSGESAGGRDFAEGEQAEQAAEDFRKGEQIIREHSAPEPDGELIANIKNEIAAKLLHKKENAFAFRRTVYKTVAVAAAFILVAVVSVKLFESAPEKPVVDLTAQKAVWENESLSDENLAAEIEQIESDLLAMRLGENGGNDYEAVTELEMELTEINSDFWKG
jgi:hypothetical protein